ncbi:alpha/beta fold hydrolase [Mycolicibacterium smegmatis]|uniref:Peptidase S9, prolyl oligopeptidase n=1 Tax=Mycolicibacterium smegmatis (strain MKD8) TaxID=1214915 RepID=A0A2U9PUU6_MYCSE|nr:alpha/beta fold hydrolase [Mycolicibacterium smegmatis]AWT55579.1 peptidase S9, prolyl oligopeptidase [Mycolicibacterium smegmatis MKD8]MCC3339715.1 alpha/beta fold hydrolase [Mycolicibacterium smegmatis]MCO4194563.1 alpha/beta fold hydrolase [Mycolicibacterium smegmatis]MCP2628133.1 alpha/beta fold hydrolase [Mycolicibacterium smegmatis]MDF1897505.1 alpha/beta fold hydrolase [Mycolicibacterium smegmatis]
MSAERHVRVNYGASLSPDATAFAHLVDDGGFPRAVQRFLRGWRASSSRDVELPVVGPVLRVLHSADGHWLACEVAPEGATRSQIWVVTTDPDDRDARRIDSWPDGTEGTAELIGWDGTKVAAILTGDDGVGSSCLIDPGTGETTVLDRRSSGRLVDSWQGASLIRVGPRGYRELIMLWGQREIALLPYDPGSTTDYGVILDDHSPRRVRSGLDGETVTLMEPHKYFQADGESHTTEGTTEGYVRALIRSENGASHARLLEVTVTADGVSYHVVAERPGYELDEFVVSDDLSTVAMLWNVDGRSELQILEYADETLSEPIPLPGMVASQLSISAGGSMVAMTVQGPSLPPTVELVDPRTREWERIDREPSGGPVTGTPTLEMITARDGLELNSWLYWPHTEPIGAMLFLHGGPEGQARPEYNEFYPQLLEAGIAVLTPNVRGSGGFGRAFMHADDKERRFAAIDDVADCVQYLVDKGLAPADKIACTGWSYGGYLTLAALTFHPELFAAGISICGMSDLNTFYRNTEPWIAAAAYPKYGHPVADRDLLEKLSPLPRAHALTAPLLLVHGANDTNVPPSESLQMYDALHDLGRPVELLMFADDGHEIIKRENRAVLVDAMERWLVKAFTA